MSHEIESMAFSGAVPWHGLGTQIINDVTALEMLQHAKLDWEVVLQKLYLSNNIVVPDYNAVVRNSDNSILGVVGKNWAPIQNNVIAETADMLAGEGNALCHTAGSLKDGRIVWFLLKIKEQLKVPKDESPIDQYLLLTNAHDGSRAMQLMFTPIRVVCNNTLNFALERNSGGIYLKHTKTAESRMIEAAKAIGKVSDIVKRFNTMAEVLVSTEYNKQSWLNQLAKVVIPDPPPTKKKTLAPITDSQTLLNDIIQYTSNIQDVTEQLIPSSIQQSRDRLLELIECGQGITNSIKGTAWSALQGVTQYLDHERNYHKNSTRAESILFGDAAYKKKKALQLIIEQTNLEVK